MKLTFEAADLFCGAGGTSTGMLQAADDLGMKLNLLAINHWPVAVNSHTLNHKGVRHRCESLDTVRPQEAVPGGRLNLLAASPECTHHSLAAGGKPKNDQSRATAWHICRWAADLTIDSIFIENVREFEHWGPLDGNGKPIKKRRGETFKAFKQALVSMGYRVEHRVQNAATFGDPTTRNRLIMLARRGDKPITWPDHTHGPGLKPFRTAREIIDWDLKGKSIFDRKRELSPNTMRRIEAGLRKYGGKNAEPFIIMLYGTGEARSVDRPLPTVTAGGNHMAIVEPFLIQTDQTGSNGSCVRSLDSPMPTLHTKANVALIEPFVIGQQSCAAPRSVDQPLPTIATAGAIQLVEPFLTKYYGTGTCAPVSEPLDTVTTKDRFLLVEPKDGKAGLRMDILIRMLQPHELSAAMSFPKGYHFYGNKAERTKQIGNAVPVELARAHTFALLNQS